MFSRSHQMTASLSITLATCMPALAQPVMKCMTISSGATNTAGGMILNLGQPVIGVSSSGPVTVKVGVVPCMAGVAGSCYPNCDGSTTSPILNINDFACFLNRFAAGDAYANCDGSTAPPVLNVNDFQCFVTKYGAGCT